MNKEPFTAGGAARLRRELDELKSVQRPRVIQAIAEARAHGDLKENAEYHAAKEQQSFIEGRIQELDDALSRADIIDPARVGAGDRVVFGASVRLLAVDTGKEAVYRIVGHYEADIKTGQISYRSPMARALIGKHSGDEITVPAPGGEAEYEILEVRYDTAG